MRNQVYSQIYTSVAQQMKQGVSREEAIEVNLQAKATDNAIDAAYDAEQAKIDAVAAKWAAVIGKSATDTRKMMERFAGDIGAPCGEWKSIPASRFSSPAAYNNFVGMMTEYDKLFN